MSGVGGKRCITNHQATTCTSYHYDQTPPHKTTEDARATSPVIGNFLSPPLAHDSRL